MLPIMRCGGNGSLQSGESGMALARAATAGAELVCVNIPLASTRAEQDKMNRASISEEYTVVRAPRSLAAMPDVHHVTVLHDVVFAFQAQRAFGAGVGFRAGFEQLVPADSLGADEVFLQ